MTTVYLIRHGYAQGNLDRTFQGSIDGKLTELGYIQLDRLAERCRDMRIDVIYSSPLSRAYETAQAVNRGYGYPVITDTGLTEIDGGDWEGRRWAELEQENPQCYALWAKRVPEFCAPNGETMHHVYERMRKTILHIAEQNQGKTIGIVSHGCAIMNFMAWAKGLGEEQLLKVPICDNTSVNGIAFADDMTPAVLFENDTSHLDEATRTHAMKMFEKSKQEELR